MPLPSFESQDQIPEAFRDSYVEKDGKWIANSEETDGLKAQQQRLLDEKKKADRELKALRAAAGDVEPEKLAEILKTHREGEDERARKAGEFDKILEKRINDVRAELDPKVKAGEDAIQRLADYEFAQKVSEAAIAAGVDAKDVRAVIKIVKGDFIRRDEKTGKLVVVDEDGDATGQTVEKFFAETFKKQFAKFYPGSGASGGGAGAGGSSGGTARAGQVNASDTNSILANLDKIAKGEVKVVAG